MPEPIKRKRNFTSLTELQDQAEEIEKELAKKLAKSRHTSKNVCDMLQTLYNAANEAETADDLEKAYLLFRKCIAVFCYHRKYTSDFDEKYVRDMVSKLLATAVNRCEELQETLKTEYEKLNAYKIKEPPGKSIDSAFTSKLPEINSEKNGSVNGVDTSREERISITCEELYKTALKDEKRAFLVIDIRLKEDYTTSRILIRSVDVINVPENMIEQSLIPSKLETKLDEEFQEMFKKRGEYGQVILMDWFSTKSAFVLDKSSPIYLMSAKLKKYDPRTKYKNKPVILEGGYNDWLDRYPTHTTNSNVSPPKKKVTDSRISIDHINYPTNVLLEPEKVEKKPATPTPPLEEMFNKLDINNSTKIIPVLPPQENGSKPTFDRSTKPILQEKQTETVAKENGVSAPQEKKPIPERTTEQKPPVKDEPSVPEKRVESFEEDEEELKNKCVRNGRRPALTSLSNQPISINNNNNADSIDSDEDFDASYRDDEKENMMNAIKNARLNVHDETSSNLKRYSSTPNISKLENEYSKPSIDRSTKPSNDDQINIFTKTAMYTDEEGRGLTGLLNVGNTCYMNSILQCLSNTEHLRKVMHIIPHNFANPKSKTEGLIAKEVGNIIKQLWMKDNGPVSCRTLKNIVGKYRDTFKGSEQQDSHEFLTILIDWLHEDLNEPMVDRCLKGADEKSGEKAWGEFISKNNSKIRQLFYGQQKSTVSCNKCEKESVTFEPFSNLSLPIPSAEKCTLAECLKLYTSNEHITGWQCPVCNNPRPATKKLDITKLPPLLVIHFKRFTSDGWCRKRLTNVDFPNLLDMTPYIIGQEHRNRRYELYAVSNHMGTMETGHYTAYCRNSVNGRWYKFDDDSVSSINNVTKSSSAYIVFYQCLLNN